MMMSDEESYELLNKVRDLHRTLVGGPVVSSRPPSSAQNGAAIEVASDADLDGKYGDPEIRRDPPRWDGPSYVGQKFSHCPADYLETLAGFYEWKATKDEAKGDEQSKKYARYARQDAARARGWAKRLQTMATF